MRARNYLKIIMFVAGCTLLAACAAKDERTDIPPEGPNFQQRVSECSMIGDRVERNRCLYGN